MGLMQTFMKMNRIFYKRTLFLKKIFSNEKIKQIDSSNFIRNFFCVQNSYYAQF